MKTFAPALLTLLIACRAEPKPEAKAPDTTAPAAEVTPTAPADVAPVADTAPSPDAAPAPDVAPPEVDRSPRLLDGPGTAPHKVLSYSAAEGFEQRLPMRMTLGVKTEVDGQPLSPELPPTTLTLFAKVDKCSDKGLELSVSALETRVEGEPTTPAGKRLAEVIAGLAGLEGQKSIDQGGRHLALTFTRPADLPAGIAPVLEGFEQALDHMLVPFPKEAIGVGARWEIEESVTQANVRLLQETTFTLEAIEGSKLTLAMAISLSPITPSLPQKTALPGGLEATLDAVEGRGEGKLVVDLAALWPTSVSVKNKIALELSLADGDKTRKLKVEMNLDLAHVETP